MIGAIVLVVGLAAYAAVALSKGMRIHAPADPPDPPPKPAPLPTARARSRR